MPAKSVAQQRLMGQVHAYQKGDLKHPSAQVKQMAGKINPTSVSHFAATKHKGLPKKAADITGELQRLVAKKKNDDTDETRFKPLGQFAKTALFPNQMGAGSVSLKVPMRPNPVQQLQSHAVPATASGIQGIALEAQKNNQQAGVQPGGHPTASIMKPASDAAMVDWYAFKAAMIQGGAPPASPLDLSAQAQQTPQGTVGTAGPTDPSQGGAPADPSQGGDPNQQLQAPVDATGQPLFGSTPATPPPPQAQAADPAMMQAMQGLTQDANDPDGNADAAGYGKIVAGMARNQIFKTGFENKQAGIGNALGGIKPLGTASELPKPPAPAPATPSGPVQMDGMQVNVTKEPPLNLTPDAFMSGLSGAPMKAGAQSADSRRFSATGESHGLSIAQDPDAHAKGQDAWSSIGKYMRGAPPLKSPLLKHATLLDLAVKAADGSFGNFGYSPSINIGIGGGGFGDMHPISMGQPRRRRDDDEPQQRTALPVSPPAAEEEPEKKDSGPGWGVPLTMAGLLGAGLLGMKAYNRFKSPTAPVTPPSVTPPPVNPLGALAYTPAKPSVAASPAKSLHWGNVSPAAMNDTAVEQAKRFGQMQQGIDAINARYKGKAGPMSPTDVSQLASLKERADGAASVTQRLTNAPLTALAGKPAAGPAGLYGPKPLPAKPVFGDIDTSRFNTQQTPLLQAYRDTATDTAIPWDAKQQALKTIVDQLHRSQAARPATQPASWRDKAMGNIAQTANEVPNTISNMLDTSVYHMTPERAQQIADENPGTP